MSLFDLSSIVLGLATGSYSVSRPGAATLDTATGRYTAGAATSFTATGSIQPASGKDLESLPEGDRAEGALKFWSNTELRLRDIVTAHGESYEVRALEGWQEAGAYYAALIVRVSNGP